MDDQLVEKVAKAIAYADMPRGIHDDAVYASEFIAEARAAIQATGVLEMREALEDARKLLLWVHVGSEQSELDKRIERALTSTQKEQDNAA